jgi:hypothetical protein
VTSTGVIVNATLLHVEAVMLLIAGFGLIVTVVAELDVPEHPPPVAITV